MRKFLMRFKEMADKAGLGPRAEALRERQLLLSGQIAARQIAAFIDILTLADVEFGVFSQWGEDGIIEWLIGRLTGIPETFIEFGVEDYLESNTRFLVQHRNWRGLVLDGSHENITIIRNSRLSWRHHLEAKSIFIDKDNIDQTITDFGFNGEIGLLSIDVDGVDYWIWEAIKSVSPWIVVIEYNAVLGDLQPLTVPYRSDFIRSVAHHSNLYFGASALALERLGATKGYTVIGSNGAGNNLFLVRNDVAANIKGLIANCTPRPSRFREGRCADGTLTLVGGLERTKSILDLPFINIETGETKSLHAHGTLFGPLWKVGLCGRLNGS